MTYTTTCPSCLTSAKIPHAADPQTIACGGCGNEFTSTPPPKPRKASRAIPCVFGLTLAVALVAGLAYAKGGAPALGTAGAVAIVLTVLVAAGFAIVGIVKAVDRRAKGTRFEKSWPFFAALFVVFPFLLPIALLWFLFEWTFYRHLWSRDEKKVGDAPV